MVCVIAVTQGGLGEIYRFETRSAAEQHPLVQYGDAICTGPQFVADQWRAHELRHLLGRHDPHLDEWLWREISAGRIGREAVTPHAGRVWTLLERLAEEPPRDPEQICEMVRRDRIQTPLTERSVLRRLEGTMSKQAGNQQEKDPKAAAGAKAGAPAAGAKAPAPKEASSKVGKHNSYDIVKLGKGKDDKPYGADNNPKRPDSKAGQRFAKLRDGMTIAQALEAGYTTADLAYDESKGFIKVEPGKAPAEPAAAKA